MSIVSSTGLPVYVDLGEERVAVESHAPIVTPLAVASIPLPVAVVTTYIRSRQQMTGGPTEFVGAMPKEARYGTYGQQASHVTVGNKAAAVIAKAFHFDPPPDNFSETRIPVGKKT